MAVQRSDVASSVNNGRRTPLQGFDVNIYIQDQATGNLVPFGEFTGFQHVIRNATEPYLPLGNRTMNLLDGEFQIGWVAEQGKINLEAMSMAFGFQTIGPIVRLGRSPRFQIVVDYDAPELHETSTTATSAKTQYLYNDIYAKQPSDFKRAGQGRYVFGFCKIDAYTTGVMAGRSAVADRIEGLAETWYWMPNSAGSTIATRQTLSEATASTTSTTSGTNYFQSLTAPTGVPVWAQPG